MNEAQFHHAIGTWSSPLPIPRMRIYRNNVVGALTAALEVRYPVTAQLVGQEFFVAMGAVFAERNRPSSPVLIDYSPDFPAFIASYEAARSVPCLADVARLESLWWQSYHSHEAEPLEAAAISRIPPESWDGLALELHPSVRLVQSPFPVASIWQAHHGGPALGSFAIDRPEHVLIARPRAEVAVYQIGESQYVFLDSLRSGGTLVDAVEAATERDTDFDIAAQISALFALGLVTGLHP